MSQAAPDHSSQYASQEYQEQLEPYGMIYGMSRKGGCWDNAVAESFFHSLKTEWMKDILYTTREQARREVVANIEMFYNCQRLHSFIGYSNPNDFEKMIEISKVAQRGVAFYLTTPL